MGKVIVLVIGLAMLAAPATAWSTSYSWSSSDGSSPFSMLGGLNSPFGMFGSSLGFGSMFGYSPLAGYSTGNYPFNYYGAPSTTSYSIFDDDMFSGFGDAFSGSLFGQKDYGTPPAGAIRDTLVGSTLSYNRSFMSIPIQYKLDETDIGDITGTQFNGEDAWKVRVGQAGVYWDVILDKTGTEVLKASQV